MQKLIKATDDLTESLGLRVEGLYDEEEISHLRIRGYEAQRTVTHEPHFTDSPLSLSLGMRLHPMYDPEFPTPELTDRITKEIAGLREAKPEIIGVALVYKPEVIIEILFSPVIGLHFLKFINAVWFIQF